MGTPAPPNVKIPVTKRGFIMIYHDLSKSKHDFLQVPDLTFFQ